MNQAFKRYRLLDDEEYERRQKQLRVYDPEIAVAASKEATIDDVINSSKLTAEEKLRLIRILHHSLKPVEQTVQPAPRPKTVTVAFQQPEFKTELGAKEAAPEMPEEVAPALAPGEHTFADLVDKLPISYRTKAVDIARLLDENADNVTFTDKFELIIEEVAIPNSNVLDLLKYLFNPRNVAAPIGYAKFINLLARLKIPPRLVSNKKVQEFLNSALQSGEGKRKRAIGYAKRPKPKTKHRKVRKLPSFNSLKSLPLY